MKCELCGNGAEMKRKFAFDIKTRYFAKIA